MSKKTYNIKAINQHGSAQHLVHLRGRQILNLRTSQWLRVRFAIKSCH